MNKIIKNEEQVKMVKETIKDTLVIGQWYWVLDEEEKWFGCVTKIGSNYVRIDGLKGYIRIHFDDFFTNLLFEPNPQSIIDKNINHYRSLTKSLLLQVRSITSRLGVSPQMQLQGDTENDNRALAVLSNQMRISDYKDALILAKEKQLPELFEAIKDANKNLSLWMSASILPLESSVDEMKDSIEIIENRIFNVSIYAGLIERIVKCSDGAPAAFHEKLHVMQRRLYMDEECLLNYKSGGMEFRDIKEFDTWLIQPENRDRILPFHRCLVAMKIRRETKERSWDGTLLSLYINIQLEQADNLTFLYIRNGDQIYRLDCELEFDEMIFPEASVFKPGEEMMVKMFCDKIDEMITRGDYEERIKKAKEKEKLSRQWFKDNPSKTWDKKKNGSREFRNPYYDSWPSFRPDDWKPFDPSNIYFDDISKSIADKINKYNRIALLIQGLFDRSSILHPHAPVKTWTPEGFEAAIKLVRDSENTLYAGEKPDFEAYRIECNRSIDENSIVTGQRRYWMMKEAEKENKRIDNDWRYKNKHHHKLFKPYGNPGPDYISEMYKFQKQSRKAIFKWIRERLAYQWRHDDPIPVTLTVPVDQLFNISAYRLGDYKKFFQDPRTRAKYLQWAPVLLAAEEYRIKNPRRRTAK